jgi:general L-amino acid transport system permease protein
MSMMALAETMSRWRQTVWQGLGLGAAAALLWWLGHNTAESLAAHGLTLGFDFLARPANFDIGDAPIRYGPEDSIGRAIVVGLANTARVSVLGWVGAIVLGFALGLARLSNNPPARALARTCVELVRNTPLLLLLFIAAAAMRALPSPAHALAPLPGVFISDRGLVLPRLDIAAWQWDMPRLAGFNFTGGLTLSPELAALLVALVLHHAVHISEVVRGAILAVPRGQRDAAQALGLSRAQTMRLVVVPQALRAMVPLMASNCVSLTKNSSLAVAIGFPDVVSVLNTTSNQTGHAIETMLIMVVVYLALSLGVSAILGRYNARLLAPGG